MKLINVSVKAKDIKMGDYISNIYGSHLVVSKVQWFDTILFGTSKHWPFIYEKDDLACVIRTED